MIPFCDNKLCRLHSVEIQGPEFDVVTYKEANGKEVKSRRRIVCVQDTRQTFALCDICAYAVALVNESQNENQKIHSDSSETRDAPGAGGN